VNDTGSAGCAAEPSVSGEPKPRQSHISTQDVCVVSLDAVVVRGFVHWTRSAVLSEHHSLLSCLCFQDVVDDNHQDVLQDQQSAQPVIYVRSGEIHYVEARPSEEQASSTAKVRSGPRKPSKIVRLVRVSRSYLLVEKLMLAQGMFNWVLMLVGLAAVIAVIVLARKRSQLQAANDVKAFTIPVAVCALASLALWIPCYFATHDRIRYLMSTVDETGRDLRSRFVTDEDRSNPCRLCCKIMVVLAVLPCVYLSLLVVPAGRFSLD
jgi:hypothetical protein